jgi:hypothetical protein
MAIHPRFGSGRRWITRLLIRFNRRIPGERKSGARRRLKIGLLGALEAGTAKALWWKGNCRPDLQIGEECLISSIFLPLDLQWLL